MTTKVEVFYKTQVLSCSLHGWGVQTKLDWILCWGRHKVLMVMSAWAAVPSEAQLGKDPQAHGCCNSLKFMWLRALFLAGCQHLPRCVYAQLLSGVCSVTPCTIACHPFCLWDFPSSNTGVDCHFLLRGIFLTKDQTCISCTDRQILYHWALGKPSHQAAISK